MPGDNQMAVTKDSSFKEELMTSEEAAYFLRTTPGVLAVWRSTGKVELKFIKVGKKVLYRYSDLLQYLEENVKTYA